jgi:hypothetical protein
MPPRTGDDSHKTQVWRVAGYDTFEACSDRHSPGGPWYEIGRFPTAAEAMVVAARTLREKGPETINDQISVIRPDGEFCRCVLGYCSECKAPNATEPTGKTKRSGWLRAKQMAEHACKHCDRTDWRDPDHVSILTSFSVR